MSDNHPAKLDAAANEQESTGGAPGDEQESKGGAPGDEQESKGGAPGDEQESKGGAPGDEQESTGGATDCERGPKGSSNNGASGEQESNGGANSSASGGKREPNGSAHAGTSGEQEPKVCATLGASSGEQEPKESSVRRGQDPTNEGGSNAFCGGPGPTEDVSNSEQNPKGNGNPDSSTTAEVSIVNPNLDVPGGTQTRTRRSKPDPSSGSEVPLEGTGVPLGSVEVEMEDMSTDASKSTGRHVEETSSPIVPRSTVGLSKEDPGGKYHVCTDTCIHGGARPKIRNPVSRSANTSDSRKSSIDSEATERMERLNRLVEGIERDLAQSPTNGTMSPEELAEMSENAICLTEEFLEELGYKPIVQFPDDPRSPTLQVHGQFDRMFLSLSFDEESEPGEPCTISRRSSNPYQEPDSGEELGDRNPCSTSGGAGLDEGQSEDPAMFVFPWQIPSEINAEVKAGKQDSVNKDEMAEALRKPDPKHQNEKIEIPEEPNLDQDDENMEGVEEHDPIRHDQGMEGIEEHVRGPQQPRQEYRLMRLAPVVPPANQMGLRTPSPRHPYRERELDVWRASMITAYRSERYHSSELLDRTMEELEDEGVSKDDFYRLYHSTRFIDFYRDEGIDETRTPSELHDMALEDRINDIIIASGYMTVAMLYMRLYMDRNPQVIGNSSESSTTDSGNVDSYDSDPKVEYVPFREYVNIEIDESTPSDTENSNTENDSSQMAIDSPDNENSPEGIQSPDLIVPPNINESIANDNPSLLLPLREVPESSSDTSSSHQSLLRYGDISDTESLLSQSISSSSQPISSSSLPHSSSELTSTSSQSHASSPRTPPPSPESRSSTPQVPPSSPHTPPPSPKSRSASAQVPPSSPQSRSSSAQVPSSSRSRSPSPLSRSPSPLSRSPSPLSLSPSPLSLSPSPQASQSPPATPSTSRAPLSTKSVKKDDLKRKAILRSYRSLSRDAPPRDATPVSPDKGNRGPSRGIATIQTAGDLVGLMVSAIFLGMQGIQQQESGLHVPTHNGAEECNGAAASNGGAGSDNRVEGQRKNGSDNRAGDALGQAENRDRVEGEKDSDGGQAEADVEDKQGAEVPAEHEMEKESEAAKDEDGGESECVAPSEMETEGSREGEDREENKGDGDQDFHMEVSKTEKDRKRKDHPDSDEEFEPKRSHIEN